MKNNKFKKLCLLLLTLIILLSTTVQAVAASPSSIKNSIISSRLSESGATSVQNWINGQLSSSAGYDSEWYIMALSQSGSYDFSKFESSLIAFLNGSTVPSASSRLKLSLGLIAAGSKSKYIKTLLDDSVGKQGVMSWIFALHVVNNGYKCDVYSPESIKNKVLSLQLADGGWSVMGTSGDVDATAMAIQALSHYKNSDTAVANAIARGLSFLAQRQQSTGDYSSYGVNNPESAAQVVIALSSLGIDVCTDGRFIKDGKNLFDVIEGYKVSEGGYAHQIGGGYNGMATMQVFFASVAYERFASGKSSIYLFDRRNPAGLETTDKNPGTQQGTSQSAVSNGSSSAENESNVSSKDEYVSVSDGKTDNNYSKDKAKPTNSTATAKNEKTEKGFGVFGIVAVIVCVLGLLGGATFIIIRLKKGKMGKQQ